MRARNRTEMELLWAVAHDSRNPANQVNALKQFEEEYNFRRKYKTFFLTTVYSLVGVALVFSIVMALVYGLLAFLITLPIALIFSVLGLFAFFYAQKGLSRLTEEAEIMWREAYEHYKNQTPQQ